MLFKYPMLVYCALMVMVAIFQVNNFNAFTPASRKNVS